MYKKLRNKIVAFQIWTTIDLLGSTLIPKYNFDSRLLYAKGMDCHLNWYLGLFCLTASIVDCVPGGMLKLLLVPKVPIHNMSSLVQVMACRLTGDKPLPEPMMTQFTEAYMQH